MSQARRLVLDDGGGPMQSSSEIPAQTPDTQVSFPGAGSLQPALFSW